MKRKGSSPTMKDVAREAGVALGTVSKVFNGIPVGDSYRRRVEDAARQLGYQVNNYARGLKTNKTLTAALILPNLTDPFFALLAEEVCRTLARRGYRMILTLSNFDPDAEQQCIRMAEQNKVDGIIGLTYNPALQFSENIPFVSIDRYFNPSVPCVASDNFGGGQMAARKLMELGCKRLLFFRIGSEVAGEADKRGDGFQSACLSAQADYELLCVNDDEGLAPFHDFLLEHISGGKLEFDGIFCNTDRLAYNVKKMLAALDLRVPEDVQLIGFDGIPMHGTGELCCSTIAQNVPQLAEASVDILLQEDRSHLPSLICLPVSYVSDATTREDRHGE